MSGFPPTSHYTQMIEAVRAWLEHDHPAVEYATVVAEQGDDLPAIQIPILQPVEVSS
jgi:hypothetical protein